jgi:hypothetical protein
MGGKGAILRVVNAAGLWLALAAMVLRLAMPAGWMPAPSMTGGTLIVMCTMNGPVNMIMPEDGAPKPDPAKKAHHDVCPFGAAPHFATVTPLPALAMPVLQALNEGGRFHRDVRPARHAYSLQIPRGPPLAA